MAVSSEGEDASDADLEAGVKRVLAAGLATGHADTWLGLLDEVLYQHEWLQRRLTICTQELESLHCMIDELRKQLP